MKFDNVLSLAICDVRTTKNTAGLVRCQESVRAPIQLRVLIEVFVVHLLFQHLVQIDLHTHWECRCMLYMGAEIYTSIYMYIYILYTDIGIIHVCVCLSVYILPVRVFFVCVCPCVCVCVCRRVYKYISGWGCLCAQIFCVQMCPKGLGPFGTLGSPHVSASSKPSKLSTASSCFFFCLQIHWLIT